MLQPSLVRHDGRDDIETHRNIKQNIMRKTKTENFTFYCILMRKTPNANIIITFVNPQLCSLVASNVHKNIISHGTFSG